MNSEGQAITAICGSCGSRYTVQESWLDKASEFSCSCGARLTADTEDLFQIHHHMLAAPEITLHPTA